MSTYGRVNKSNMANGHLVKISFELEPDTWHGHARESLWAEKVGGNRYRLKNSPFYARGASFEDIIVAESDRDGQLVFRNISICGGHSTYRIMLQVSVKDPIFQERWSPLEKLGCSFEGVGGKLLAIDVPPAAEIHEVYSLLQAGQEAGVWDFEEGHCGHPVKTTT